MNTQIKKAIDNIFRINLGVKKQERVIVLADDHTGGTEKIGQMVFSQGKKHSGDIQYIEIRSTGCHGTEPPEDAWKAAFGGSVFLNLKKEDLLKPLLAKQTDAKKIKRVENIIKRYKDEAADVIIALPYFSTSHTRFRDMLNRICGTRYASMPIFDMAMLTGAMRVDWKKMFKRTEKTAKIVNRFDGIEIESDNGTRITFSKKGRAAMSDTGIITRPGSFSNLPAGEVYFAPLEGTAEGRLVLEWAPTRKLKSPVTLYVKKGLVSRVEGKEEFAYDIEKKLSEQKENRNIAELGIGTNDRASRPDNILESEKIYGTIHIALGDNSSFGGRVSASFHQDFVFFHPTVRLVSREGRKRTLLLKGKMMKSWKCS